MIEFMKCIATPSSLAHSLLSLPPHPLSPSLHTHILPLHSLPNPLPKPTEDYTGRYQNSGTTPTEMNFGNKAVHQ